MRLKTSIIVVAAMITLAAWYANSYRERATVNSEISADSRIELRQPETVDAFSSLSDETSFQAPFGSSAGNTVSKKDTFGCKPVLDDETSLESEIRFSRQRAAISKLTQSDDPEHLVLAARIMNDAQGGDRIALMQKAMAMQPDNPVFLWIYLADCVAVPAHAECSSGRLERLIVTRNHSNGMIWAFLAADRFENDDKIGALAALKLANTAPVFDSYWAEQIVMYERGLAAAYESEYADRIITAIGVSAATVVPYGPLVRACQELAPDAGEWLNECLSYGRRLETDERIMLSNRVGLRLQELMYEISGDDEKKDAAIEKYQSLENFFTEPEESEVLMRDERVLAAYLGELAAHGEIAAAKYLRNEVKSLRELPGYSPCPDEQDKVDGSTYR